MDVIALHQAGIAEAVAPLGTALTEQQLEALWRLAEDPVLCFDGDEAGARAAARAVERALPQLSAKRSLRFATLPAGQDPDTMVRDRGRRAMAEIVAAAVPLSDQLWKMAAGGRMLETPEARARVSKQLQDQVARIPDRDLGFRYMEDYPAAPAAALAGAAAGRRAVVRCPRAAGATRRGARRRATRASRSPASALCFRSCSASPRWRWSSTRRWLDFTWKRPDSLPSLPP